MKKILLTKKSQGNKWPFNVDAVIIKKGSMGDLYVIANGVKYNLNGVAKKGVDIYPIWMDNPEIWGTKKSLSPIFNACKEKGLI